MTNPPSNKPSIGSQMARGVGWMMLMKLVVRSLGLVSTLILVRLLTPVDFGIVAMAMVFISVLEVLSWFSFDMAIIQHKNPTPEHYDTAWTFNLIFKCCSALILILGAVPIANYYEQPEVATIVWLLAGGVIARGFENVGIVDFRKNMEFDKEFRFMLIRKVAAFAVTVPLAFWLRNYWALIAGMLTGQAASVIASYVLSPYRPKLSLAARDHLFNFSNGFFWPTSAMLFVTRPLNY